MGFVDLGSLYREGQAQALEEFAAEGGGGCKNQGWLGAQVTPVGYVKQIAETRVCNSSSAFDLGVLDTYDTRPMSEGWSKLLDIGPLADGRAEVDFSIPLKEFPRVLPVLAAPEGTARGRVRFTREGGIAVAEVDLTADVVLLCQRCLSPLSWPVKSSGRAALVATAAAADRVPPDLEAVMAPEYQISIRDLVEEELLLALPLVPRHENDKCAGVRAGTSAEQSSSEGPAGETHRPFGQLGELFKRQ
jgi:uncharacterized protein